MILLWHRSHTMCRVGSAAFASGAVHHRKIHQLYNWILWSYIAVIIQYIIQYVGLSTNALSFEWGSAVIHSSDLRCSKTMTFICCYLLIGDFGWKLGSNVCLHCGASDGTWPQRSAPIRSKIDCLFRGSRRNNNNLSSSHNNTTVHYALWFCFQVTKQSMFHGGIFGVSSRVLQPHVTAHEMLSDCGHAHASAGAYRAGCRCYNAALFQTRFHIHCTSRSATLLSVAQLQPTFTFTAAPHWHRRLWSRYLDDLCGDLAGKKIAIKTCPPRQVTA